MADKPTVDEALKYVMPFGKYRGLTMQEIVDTQITYLDWLAGLQDLREPLATYVEVLCEEYDFDIEEAIKDRSQDWD